MDVLMDIVRNLLVIIVMSSFLELLLPEGQLKPFVRFSIGLFVIIAVLSPTLSYLYEDRDFEVEYWNYEVDDRLEKQILENGKKIQKDLEREKTGFVQEKVQGQISAVAMLVPGVDDVHTEIELAPDGSVRRVNLHVLAVDQRIDPVDQVNVFSGIELADSLSKQTEISQKIQQVIKNLYGINGENIEINFEGGKKSAGRMDQKDGTVERKKGSDSME